MRRLIIFSLTLSLVGAGSVRAETPPSAIEKGASTIQNAREKLKQLKKYREEGFPHSGHTKEEYTVGAQYRGAVKQSFNNLGTGSVECDRLADNHFRVRFTADVRNPQKENKQLKFDVTREFRLQGNRIEMISEKNEFSAEAEKYQKKILNTLTILYLIKWNSAQDDAGPFTDQVYKVDDGTYNLTFNVEKSKDYAETGRWLVSNLTDDEGNKASFFMGKTYRGVRPLDKFRVHTKNNVVISFYGN